METNHSYCKFTNKLSENNLHKIYHNTEYGFPVISDKELFGRLILEINQAGLSWDIILKKRNAIKKAYSNFNIQKVAKYQESDIEKLLNNKRIIRNRLKINAIIYNAKRIIDLQNKFGSFKKWLDNNSKLTLSLWITTFKKNFKFTGKEITKEFLISTGYVKGAHTSKCKIFRLTINAGAMWYKIKD